MSKLFRPMLAAKPDPEDLDAVLASLRHPLLGSPKLDGIRCLVQEGKLYSRNLKLIPNLAMQALWGDKKYNGLDGEIIVGPPTAEDCFNRSTSAVMSRSKSADGATFNVFDCFPGKIDHNEPFDCRLDDAYDAQCGNNYIVHVTHTELRSLRQLLAYEAKTLAKGHEGIMLRDPNGVYKQGRSTLKEGGLIAVKRFVDAEAVILDTEEQMENTNAQVVNELGRMKRSTHKAGKVGKGTLGAFVVTMLPTGKVLTQRQIDVVVGLGDANPDVFNVGGAKGLTDAMRKELWAKRDKLPGKIIKFRYQKIGTMVAPRQPIFIGFRDKSDM